MKKSMPPDHPPLAPEEDLVEANARWTTSSTPSAHTTRTCATPFRTTETSSIPWGTADPSNLCRLPHHEEDLENLNKPNNRRGRRWSLPTRRRRSQRHLWRTWVARKQEATKSQRPSDIGGDRWTSRPISMVRVPDHLHSGGSVAQLRPPGQVPAPRRSGDLRKQGKKGTSGWGKQHQRHLPRTLQGLGVPLKELHESDTPFFGIMPTEGEYPLGHIYMSVTFGTPENYRTEFLRFEVANFDYGYNTIIGRLGFSKFMAIPHYTYMILKMPEPQGIITVRADFQGAAECFRVAIQAALTTKPSATSSAQAISKPEEDLVVPANEAQAVTSMRPTKETKRINLGFADEHKTAIIGSSLNDK
jgi:hypothetical protein